MNAIARIKEHMQVFGSDGTLVGVVDHMEGEDRIKLTKSDSADGQHHFIDAGSSTMSTATSIFPKPPRR